jgi:hypothetical protein
VSGGWRSAVRNSRALESGRGDRGILAVFHHGRGMLRVGAVEATFSLCFCELSFFFCRSSAVKMRELGRRLVGAAAILVSSFRRLSLLAPELRKKYL